MQLMSYQTLRTTETNEHHPLPFTGTSRSFCSATSASARERPCRSTALSTSSLSPRRLLSANSSWQTPHGKADLAESGLFELRAGWQ